MAKLENKSSFCLDCLYVFDSLKKYHSRDRCNPCYQKLYIKDKLGDKKKEVSTNCSVCNAEYGSLNEKGRAVIRGPKDKCKKCYSKSKKPKKECENCGNTMLAGSNTGLCVICRELKRAEGGKRSYNKKKIKELPFLDIETYETVRRLLVRFKYGNNGIVDNFRVIDVYMDLYDNPVFLDTLTEEAQIIEMLRYLKKVYDFNKEDRDNKLEIEKKKAEFKKKYYKYQKKEKKVNLTADMKAYRKAYYQKHYAKGGYIKYLMKREEKN